MLKADKAGTKVHLFYNSNTAAIVHKYHTHLDDVTFSHNKYSSFQFSTYLYSRTRSTNYKKYTHYCN